MQRSRRAVWVAAVAILALGLGSLATWKVAPAVPRQLWNVRQAALTDHGEFRVNQFRWLGGTDVLFWRRADRLEDMGQDQRPLSGVEGWKSLPVRVPDTVILGFGEAVQVRRRGWPLPHLQQTITSGGWGSKRPLGVSDRVNVLFAAANVVAWSIVAAPAAALFVMGIVKLKMQRQRRRRLDGLCHACGYDLQGLTGAVPCPECGQARTNA